MFQPNTPTIIKIKYKDKERYDFIDNLKLKTFMPFES